jgi:cytochrome c
VVRFPGHVVAALVVAAIAVGYVGNRFEDRFRTEDRARALTGGDPDRGRQDIMRAPCGRCHTIPGIPGAKAKVGPPLTAFSGRAYIAGRASNSPDALVAFLENPQGLDPDIAMPPMGIGERQARDIAAYLYTLQ